MAHTAYMPHTGDQRADIKAHPAYNASIEEWERIRDCIKGGAAIKARGPRYLPKLHEQEEDEYNAYRARALFFNGTRRTRDAATGLLLRKTPELNLESALDALQADADLQGSTLLDYARVVCEEMSSLGRSGTLIDWSEAEQRAYFAFYHAEDIVSWECRRIRGKMVLTFLVLREVCFEIGEDGTPVEVEVLREFRNREGNAVELVVSEYRDGSQKKHKQPLDLKRRGKALEAIPFVFHTLAGDKPDVCQAPLADLADINISHYRTSADLENGRHVAGLPTPFAAGFPAETELVLGTNHAWVSEQTDAKAGFVEFTGQGLGSLEKALQEKQAQMAALGARMLEPQSADAESFQTVQLRANSEQASLVNLSSAVSATLSKALQWAAWWAGTKAAPADHVDENSIVLATDFVAAKLDGPTLTALVSAYQSGAISWPTFYHNLEQGEFYAEGWTIEEEEGAIETKAPEKPETDAEKKDRAAAEAALKAKAQPPTAKPAAKA